MLEDVKKNVEGFMNIGGITDMIGNLFPTEKDPSSGPVETVSEMIASALNVGESAVLALTDLLGLPSIREMAKEISAEYEAADILCDKIGGQSVQLPGLPDPTLCVSPKQIAWGTKPENVAKLGQFALACGLEENVVEPLDYWLSIGKIVQEGNYEKLAGFGLGLAEGEGLPDIAHPLKWLIGPFSFSACVQAKIAKEMGDITQEGLEEIAKNIYTATGRDTGVVKGLLKNVGL